MLPEHADPFPGYGIACIGLAAYKLFGDPYKALIFQGFQMAGEIPVGDIQCFFKAVEIE
jgi:hypothetical protein